MRTTLARLGVEILEHRDCPATAYLFNNVLTVTGTEGDDTLQVTESLGQIRVGILSFNAAAVNTVVITGLGGNDTIRDDTTKPSVIYGGVGNDWIYSGRGNDTVYGGQGDDALFGGPANDVVYGGYGNDVLTDTGGVNTLVQGSPSLTRGNSVMEAEIFNRVNAFRVANGLPALRLNTRLNSAADLHSLDMVAISNVYGPTVGMQHVLNGTTHPQINDRLDAAGYDEWSSGFRYGENIAYGFTTAAAVVQAWINSPGHRANILNATFSETGVSIRTDNAGRLFFTQDFGYLAR